MIRLLDAIPVHTALGVRDRAMLETLYGGGLRVSELVGLNLDDIDFESDLVRVRGKGRRERLSPVGPMAIRWINHYLPIRQPESAGEQAVFLNRYGDSADNPERGTAPGGSPGTSRTDQRRQPPYPAAQFRHAPAGQGSRSPQRSRIARTPQSHDHADLHPRHAGPLAAYISGGASSCSIRLFENFLRDAGRGALLQTFFDRPLGSNTGRMPVLTCQSPNPPSSGCTIAEISLQETKRPSSLV